MLDALRPDFAKDTLPQDAARIYESWLRCSDLDNRLLSDPNPVSRINLEYKREANQFLLNNSSASIKALAAMASSLDSVVVLTDANGLILFELGSNKFQSKSHKIALQAGVNWSEQLKGTNAIGTALHDGKAVRIHGREHFIEHNKILSCHAAPIFSATGEILGILDISGPANYRHAQTLAIVKKMSLNIANQMLDDSNYDRFEFCMGGSNREFQNRAILLLDDNKIITGANETALQLLQTNWSLIGTSYSQWLDGNPSLRESKVFRLDGQVFTGRIKQSEKPKLRSINLPATNKPTDNFPIDIDSKTATLLDQAIRAIDNDLSILIQGETGTGKEILANRIHQNSKWKKGKLIAINCAALPAQLIESELFGYAPGAFTGARKDGYQGLLLQANEGILFLDEIGDMPLELQSRLLRVLQERKVLPLGSDKHIELNFGLISATNQNLKNLIKESKFRADLFYRLQDMPIELPALRSRNNLLEFIGDIFKKIGGNLSIEAQNILASHEWPGNYRELRSVLLRLVCQHPNTEIKTEMLPDEITQKCVNDVSKNPQPSTITAKPDLAIDSNTLKELEKQAIQQAIREHNGNISLAAKHLGIHRSTLYRKLSG